ncbi:MAG: riboflavin synthase [Bacteroidetes bacterium]|nr:riboflavin synthase [Bacteroidota bacterium]
MFTGIIETTGKVISLKKDKANLEIWIESSIAKELKIGQSVAHNGVCLTVTSPLVPLSSDNRAKREGWERSSEVGSVPIGASGGEVYFVTAVKETLDKSNLGLFKKGSIVNLERSLKIGDRLDGHFVQGHVDNTAVCAGIKKQNGSWLFKFQVTSSKSQVTRLVIEKGSVCINGVSLTVVEVKNNIFSVAIIPHTFKHTNFSTLKKGDLVNIEFDVLGKYIQNIIAK